MIAATYYLPKISAQQNYRFHCLTYACSTPHVFKSNLSLKTETLSLLTHPQHVPHLSTHSTHPHPHPPWHTRRSSRFWLLQEDI